PLPATRTSKAIPTALPSTIFPVTFPAIRRPSVGRRFIPRVRDAFLRGGERPGLSGALAGRRRGLAVGLRATGARDARAAAGLRTASPGRAGRRAGSGAGSVFGGPQGSGGVRGEVEIDHVDVRAGALQGLRRDRGAPSRSLPVPDRQRKAGRFVRGGRAEGRGSRSF